jgi:predicted ferric reductase
LGAPLSVGTQWNLWVAGALVVVLSLAAFVSHRPWQEWITALIGAWLVASPWIFGLSASTALTWSTAIAGGALLVLGIWAAIAERQSRGLA